MNGVCNLAEDSILIRSTPVFYQRKHVYALAKVRSEKTNQELKVSGQRKEAVCGFCEFCNLLLPGTLSLLCMDG